VRAMNRLMRAGFSSNAIYKVLREWNLPEEAMPVEGGADSDSYAERDEDLPEF
jgi:regulatory protein